MPLPLAGLIAGAARAVGPAVVRSIGRGVIKAGVSVTMDGIDEAKDAIQNGADALSPREVENITQRWIDRHFVPEARRIVPVDTGELQDSIDGEANGYNATLEATADHAGYVEEGTEHMRAQPFMEPAEERTIQYLLNDLGEAFEDVNIKRKP